MVITFKVIRTVFQNIFGYFFQPRFFFLKVLFNESGNIDFFIFIYWSAAFLHKHIKTPDHQEAIRSCSRYKFIDTCENIQYSVFNNPINHRSLFNLKAEAPKFRFIFSFVVISFRWYKFNSKFCSSGYNAMLEWMEHF